jgi:hypothetical protein
MLPLALAFAPFVLQAQQNKPAMEIDRDCQFHRRKALLWIRSRGRRTEAAS